MPQHPVDVHVGKRIKLRRNMLGMSQERLGKSIGVTFQQIQKYESGKNRVGSSRLFDFAKTLGVQISFFFEDLAAPKGGRGEIHGFAEEKAPLFEAEQWQSRETMELVRYFHSINDPAIKKQILSFVKSMATLGSRAVANKKHN